MNLKIKTGTKFTKIRNIVGHLDSTAANNG